MPIITYLDNDGNVQTAQTNHRYSATIDQDYNLGDTDIRPGDTLIEFSFYGRDFPNADFSGITFRGCNFKSSNFSNANFNDCAFYGTNKYTEIDFQRNNLYGTDFKNSVFHVKTYYGTGTQLYGHNFENTKFYGGIDLASTSSDTFYGDADIFTNSFNGNNDMYYDHSTKTLKSKKISYLKKDGSIGTYYRGTTNTPRNNITPGADLSGWNLSSLDLTDANLSNIDLTNVDLTDTVLIGVDLTNSNLANTNLIGKNLTGARLYETNLSGAHLIDVDLTNAFIANTDFTGAFYVYNISLTNNITQ